MLNIQILSFLTLLSFSLPGFSSTDYQYTLLNSTGATFWKFQENQQTDFDNIKIEKKSLTNAELLKTYPKLSSPRKIAILGDTGCRLKESALKRSYQNCSDSRKWRYPTIIISLEKENPDLIIHLGDYHYREQCSAGRPCQKMSPVVGYGWEPWKLDFFAPSQNALKHYPWLIVRGNHEDCRRAYLGYKTLLRSTEWQENCVETEDLQVISLGDLAILNLDSSSITDMPDFSEKSQSQWKKYFDSLNQKINSIQAKRIWLVTHKPIYGLVRMAGTFAPVNMNLRKYFENASWAKKVEIIFSGHIHSSQVTKAKNYPLQLVIGNGGTTLESSRKIPTTENLSALNYEKAKIINHDFGYVLVTNLQSENPKLEFHNADGKIVFSCQVKNKGEDCFKFQ